MMQRYISLDVGTKTIGVAVSDELGLTAQGVTTIQRKNFQSDLNQITELIKKYDTNVFVVGLPKNMNGTEGPRCQSIRDFARELQNRIEIQVRFWDERLSTVEAERRLIDADISRRKRKTIIDKQAAVIILQGFLDSIKIKGDH